MTSRYPIPFAVICLVRELTYRVRQALFIASGLAVGVGLVITVTAATTAIQRAQHTVLHSLYGIGTDITVTRTAPPAPHDATLHSGPQWTTVLPVSGLAPLDARSVADIAHLPDVARAAGCLELTELVPVAGGLPNPVRIDGVDIAHPDLGPLDAGKLAAGRSFTAADARSPVAVVSVGYAAANRLAAGATIRIGGTAFTVIGIDLPIQTSGSASIYLPLGQAQLLTGDGVNLIYVAATDATTVPAAQREIAARFPTLTVTSADSLAGTITGSLGGAAKLADNLGRWVAVAALVTAFVVATVLTLGAVARRTPEFGTLTALGWPASRIIAQILGESAVIGIIGATVGVALGFGGVTVVNLAAPQLSAAVGQQSDPNGPMVIPVRLAAQLSTTGIGLAMLLAMTGALLAGSFGAWRATRLSPAGALARIE